MTGGEPCTSSPSQTGNAHLAVLHHGLWGSCRDLHFVEARLIESGWLVLNSTCNSERYTYDGIDICGDRLVRETRSCCARWLSKGILVSKVSFIGYSLGGLVVRYAIGKLQATGFFAEVQPVNFVTFASPHLGAYRQPGATATERLCNVILPWTLSRTGAQLVLGDNFLGGLPLLFVMAHPQYAFVEALHCFENRILLANIKGDTTVPFFSAAMCVLNPFERSSGLPLSAKYPCIVRTELRNWKQSSDLSTANNLQPHELTFPHFGPSPPPSPPSSSAPSSIQSHHVGLEGGLGCSKRSITKVRSRQLQPQTPTAINPVTSGSQLAQSHTSIDHVHVQDQRFTLAVRQRPPHISQNGYSPALRQDLAGSFRRDGRQRDVLYGQQVDVYHDTGVWRGGGGTGRSTRPERSGRKLGRLDSRSFLLLLPLFLVVWLFMVALLTLWGMRHYLTRVSVGITRDRSWSVRVIQANAAGGADGKGCVGGGTGFSQRGSNGSSTRRTYTNGTPVMEPESSAILETRGFGTSGGSSSTNFASQISYLSEDLGGDEYDGPALPSVADEIRSMAAACRDGSNGVEAAAANPTVSAFCTLHASTHYDARSSACSDGGTPPYKPHASLALNGFVRSAIVDGREPHPGFLQTTTHQQAEQQPWLWSLHTNSPPHRFTAIQSMPAARLQSREAEPHTCSSSHPSCHSPLIISVPTQQCKQDALSVYSHPVSSFPCVQADIHAHRTDTSTLSTSTRGSRPPARRKLLLFSEAETDSCDVVAQCGIGCVSIVVANVSCIMKQEGSIPQQCISSISSKDQCSSSSRSSSEVEDVCSSGKCSINSVDAGRQAHVLGRAGTFGDLQPQCLAGRCKLHSPLPHICLAYPPDSGHQSGSPTTMHGSVLHTHLHLKRDHSTNCPETSTSVCPGVGSPPLVLPPSIPGSVASDAHDHTLISAEASSVVVSARLTTTSTTTIVTSSTTATLHTWLLLASSAASFAVLKSASLIPRSIFVSRLMPDPDACSLGPALGLSRREWQDVMMENMNGLGWQKIHVDTHHYHAHAAIVVRSYRRFPAQEHIVEYMVRQMRL